MASPAPQAPIVNLNMILDQVAKDKGIERSVLVQTLESAIAQAAKKHFGQDRAIEATYNEEKGVVEVFQTLTVVPRVEVEDPIKSVNQISLEDAGKKGIEAEVGDELLFQIFYRPEDEEEARVQDERYGDILHLKTYRKSFGRIAAQTAKQVIIQRTRDAERENVFNDYKDRKGEIVSGIVLRFERGNIIVNLGRAEAVLPVREQTPRESYRAGDRVQAFVLDALQPAEVTRVLLDEQNKAMEIIVPDDQLSLAIGRRGQNVRLAAQLTGWKLDINSETRVKELREFAQRSLTAIGMPEATV